MIIPYFWQVQFLFPVFLAAGLTLLIPVLIHLFNLRRYKTVLFPHTRFLKNLQLHSRKQSQLRYKWLLLTRLLFLVFLVLAFAQPFFSDSKGNHSGKRLAVLYVDNSYSMSLMNGQRSLLDKARQQASELIRRHQGSIVVLSNDPLINYTPLSREQALQSVARLGFSSFPRTNIQVLQEIQNVLQDNAATEADVYYFSDMQRNDFKLNADKALMDKITFNGVLVQHADPQNVYIDTAYFELPVIQSGQDNRLIVRSRFYGKAPAAGAVLQLSVNGQLKSAASPVFNDNQESIDTLSFQVNDAAWQRIALSVADVAAHFDDTFYIAGRSSSDLSVLLLNQDRPNAYIQAALHAYSGFKADERSLQQLPEDITAYNLILVNGITTLDNALAARLAKALQQGQNVCIFPGPDADLAGINEGLRAIGDIQFTGVDTAVQAIATLQSQHRLVKDIFEHIPDNIQLPVVRRHYSIKAGLSANQQSVFNFRNGDPFFAAYSLGAGQLYLCASAADMGSSNFPASYFFVPFIYQMASLATGNSLYAVAAGQQAPVFIRSRMSGGRDVVHIRGNGMDVIPPQRAEGMGAFVFVGKVIHDPGYYNLTTTAGDSTLVAVNASRSESDLSCWTLKQLQEKWQGKRIHWQEAAGETLSAGSFEQEAFPLWKLCTILALSMLVLETVLLARNLRNKKTITT